jgi:hypothetical protein
VHESDAHSPVPDILRMLPVEKQLNSREEHWIKSQGIYSLILALLLMGYLSLDFCFKFLKELHECLMIYPQVPYISGIL